MHVEECCQALLAYLLPSVDPLRRGIAVDIGVGTFAFYCEVFADLGFDTIAVEPRPIAALQYACRKKGIKLLEACISDKQGPVRLYLGAYQGVQDTNLNSLLPDWWGSSTQFCEVQSQRFSDLLDNIGKRGLTCLKMDVEGTELDIINQLEIPEEDKLPDVLMFEYGGGSTLREGKGGWSPSRLEATLQCFSVLKRLGYSQTVIVDSSPLCQERVLDLQAVPLCSESFFLGDYIYGNAITMRRTFISENSIRKVCKPYRDNKLPAPAVQTGRGKGERFLRRIWRAFGNV